MDIQEKENKKDSELYNNALNSWCCSRMKESDYGSHSEKVFILYSGTAFTKIIWLIVHNSGSAVSKIFLFRM